MTLSRIFSPIAPLFGISGELLLVRMVPSIETKRDDSELAY